MWQEEIDRKQKYQIRVYYKRVFMYHYTSFREKFRLHARPFKNQEENAFYFNFKDVV